MADQSILADDSDLLVLSPLAISAGLASDEAGSSSTSGRLKAGFAEAAQKVADFRPQIMIYYLGGGLASAESAPSSEALDLSWAGRWATTVAAKHCSGRALAVSNHSQTLSQFFFGMLESPGGMRLSGEEH